MGLVLLIGEEPGRLVANLRLGGAAHPDMLAQWGPVQEKEPGTGQVRLHPVSV